MPTNYVLVDFENVQPSSLAALDAGSFKVMVFIGAHQAKGRISFELSHSIQKLGANAEYVTIARSGPNAVDMHIAYFIGKLVERERDANIFVISRDTDFDPLVEYLREAGVSCKRVKAINDIPKQGSRPPASKPARSAANPAPAAHAQRKQHTDRLAPIIKHLHSMSGKPATRKKLSQTIGNYFKQHGGALVDKQVEALIDELIRLKYVSQAGTKVSYHLA